MHKLNLKISITSLALLLCLHFASARLKAQEAYKIDEAVNPRCDLSEVPPLDPPPGGTFATTLRDKPEAKGAIVVYGLQGTSTRYAQYVKERLIHFAGVAAERLIRIYGGRAEDSRLELWIIPRGAATPKSNFVEDTTSARQLDTYSYWDGESCGGGRLPAFDEFAKALKQRPDWQGYIVIRPHRNKRGDSIRNVGWDPDGYVSRQQALRRVAKDKSYVIRKSGLAPARIKAVVGDNDEWTHGELWLVPPGAEPPVAKAKSSNKER